MLNTPNCSPSGAITRIGLMRICRLTRMRGALLLVLSIARFGSPPQKGKADSDRPGIRCGAFSSQSSAIGH